MDQPKISVIVPVYNVEKYLRECVDSILAQTFYNLEIILVDNGSTDASGSICDEYAGKDSRIKVLHTENKGISAARNLALDIMTGDWVGFVDSDDWIEKDMFRKLLETAQAEDTPLAACSRILEFKDRQISTDSCREKVVLRNKDEIIDTFLNGKVFNNVVWERIYRREFFDGIRFPLGLNYEDSRITNKIVSEGWPMAYIPDRLYHYRQRKSSIVHIFTLKNAADLWESEIVQLKEICGDLPEPGSKRIRFCLHAAALVWDALSRSSKVQRAEYSETAEEICSFSRKLRTGTGSEGLGYKERIIVFLTSRNNIVAYLLVHLIRKLNSLLRKEKVVKQEELFD